jgi:hypothetical protein
LPYGIEDPQSPKHATTIFKGKEHGEAVQQFHLQISTNHKYVDLEESLAIGNRRSTIT